MRVRRIIKPGDKGARKLSKDYGEQLICVRYRYDHHKRLRHKTIEIIIDTQPWNPPPPHPEEDRPRTVMKVSADEVGVRIGYGEKDLQRQIKSIGGRWQPDKKLWYANEVLVQHIGLGDRIVKND